MTQHKFLDKPLKDKGKKPCLVCGRFTKSKTRLCFDHEIRKKARKTQ